MVCLCRLRIGWRGATAPVLASSAGDLLHFLHLRIRFYQVQHALARKTAGNAHVVLWLWCMTMSTEKLESGMDGFCKAFCDDSPLCVHMLSLN